MNPDSAWNMFVFRDGRRTLPGATLARTAAEAIRAAAERPYEPELLNALLLTGELECALIDADCPEGSRVAAVTDALAEAVVAGQSGLEHHLEAVTADLSSLLGLIPEHPPAQLKVSPPEGFAYYALHPLDFADLAAHVPLSSQIAGVIGIRTIGATLSALVTSALRLRGIQAQRWTVRPSGHPYDRVARFTRDQAACVDSLRSQNADFLVVDEGPGMSGSSFLSIGDALADAGVPRERIAFLGSRIPDPDTLRATDAGRRWRAHRSHFAQKNSRLPLDAKIYIGGGDWRHFLLKDAPRWPASWTQMERLKFLSPDRRLLFKFEGFGRFGAAVHQREQQVGEAGFGPRALDFTQGFGVYPILDGRPLTPDDLTPALLDRMADYCAFRACEFRSCDFRSDDGQNATEIETMLRFNLSEAFGYDLPLAPGALHSTSPVVVDGRMLPHEWIGTSSGYMKVDGGSHGDDHFFPGPTDIAWDLAGAIVEWNMPSHAVERLLARYRQATGDDPAPRLPGFLLAYTVFRLGYCRMAAEAVRGSGEENRLLAAHQVYRTVAQSMLPPTTDRTGRLSPLQSPSDSAEICLT